MPRGGYPGNDKVLRQPPLVPLSDGAGQVVAVGPGVRRFSVGQRVLGCFFQNWASGGLSAEAKATALGGAIDGLLAERVVLPESGLVALPDGLSFAQGATLPCAALTAWAALTAAETVAGDVVLLLGTGGVSTFGLQLCRALGVRAIVTSSSDEKLQRAKELGAAELINYQRDAKWDERVIELTGGVGADHVLEVGGAGTLERSLRAVRIGGTVSLIGVLSGNPAENPSVTEVLFKGVTLRGIYVGSREQLVRLLSFLERHAIRPVIDRTFDFTEARAAYRYLKSGRHFGKVVIERGTPNG